MIGNSRLTLDELIRLAEEVADENYLKPVCPEFIKSAYKTGKTVISYQHGDVLWINRDFIAYAMMNGHVNYVYVTMNHIRSERHDFAKNRRKRLFDTSLPIDISVAFNLAELSMKMTGRRYWVDEIYSGERCFEDDNIRFPKLDPDFVEVHDSDSNETHDDKEEKTNDAL